MLIGELTVHTARGPVVVYTEACHHAVPLVMSQVIQATEWRIVLT